MSLRHLWTACITELEALLHRQALRLCDIIHCPVFIVSLFSLLSLVHLTASLQTTKFCCVFSIISNVSVDILQNVWPKICRVTWLKQGITETNNLNTCTQKQTTTWTNHIWILKRGVAPSPPTPSGDGYGVCRSVWVVLVRMCSGVLVHTSINKVQNVGDEADPKPKLAPSMRWWNRYRFKV